MDCLEAMTREDSVLKVKGARAESVVAVAAGTELIVNTVPV